MARDHMAVGVGAAEAFDVHCGCQASRPRPRRPRPRARSKRAALERWRGAPRLGSRLALEPPSQDHPMSDPDYSASPNVVAVERHRDGRTAIIVSGAIVVVAILAILALLQRSVLLSGIFRASAIGSSADHIATDTRPHSSNSRTTSLLLLRRATRVAMSCSSMICRPARLRSTASRTAQRANPCLLPYHSTPAKTKVMSWPTPTISMEARRIW